MAALARLYFEYIRLFSVHSFYNFIVVVFFTNSASLCASDPVGIDAHFALVQSDLCVTIDKHTVFLSTWINQCSDKTES